MEVQRQEEERRRLQAQLRRIQWLESQCGKLAEALEGTPQIERRFMDLEAARKELEAA